MSKEFLVTEYGVREGTTELQTAALQAVFDLCRESGGTVVIPAGRFYTGGLWMHSGTTLLLKTGATLVGSEDCNDFPVFPIPEGMTMYSDMELLPAYYWKYFQKRPWPTYRRAILSAYGQDDLAIIGEPGSYIDGQDCYDPDGEESYRGPHAIYLSNCRNITFAGYTVQNAGNFLHQLDNCENITMRDVTCLAASDGIHLHYCKNTVIEDCIFRTGDDCIAGINVQNLRVSRCVLNTSCSCFRLGGTDVTVEDCHMYGPGFYPHRMTVVKSRTECLPRHEGRHNTLNVWVFFGSPEFHGEPCRNIVFRNCLIENIEAFLHYEAGGILMEGTDLAEFRLENVKMTELMRACPVSIEEGHAPLTVTLKNVRVAFRDGCQDQPGLFVPDTPNLRVIRE